MDKFEQFLLSQDTTPFLLADFLIALLLGVVLGLIIKLAYDLTAFSVSNKKTLSNNFIALVLLTTFIISVVKSSLALSLGLVGALSIVRFRTAIKEPVELIYLFFCIAVGLGLGANQLIMTLSAVGVITTFIFAKFFFFEDKNIKSLSALTISLAGKNLTNLDAHLRELEKYCDFVNL